MRTYDRPPAPQQPQGGQPWQSGLPPERAVTGQDWLTGGVFCALAILIPLVFGATGMGATFLPMYLPVFALALIAPWQVALVVGIVSPLLAGALNGLLLADPPAAILMAIELGGGATVAAMCRALNWSLYPALICGLICARSIGVTALVTVGRLMGHDQSVNAYVRNLTDSWPGLVLVLIVVPTAVYAVRLITVASSGQK